MRRWLACIAPMIALGALTPLAPSLLNLTPQQPASSRPDASKTPERLPPPEIERDGPTKLDKAAMEKLAKTDPVAFLAAVVERYEREVRSYRVTLAKEE